MEQTKSSEIEIVRGEAFGRLRSGTLNFRLLKLRLNRTGNAGRDLVLQTENVLQASLEVICPNVSASGSIDQLTCEAHAISSFAYSSLKQVAHAQFPANLSYVYCPTLVSEARIARNYEERRHPRKRGDYVFDHSVGEIFLFRVTAQIYKGQHSYRWFVGKKQRLR